MAGFTRTMEPAIAISSVVDGSMSTAHIGWDAAIKNRQLFLKANDILLEETILVRLDYASDDFCRYEVVDGAKTGDGMCDESTIVSDTLFTKERKIALFLPLADCIGAVLYDSQKKILGLAHLGRHNLEQIGGQKNIAYMQEQFGCQVADIQVYLSPAVSKVSYPMFNFENRSLHEVACQQLRQAGILEENITLDDRDTAVDDSFFSHSQFLAGRQETDGRHAIVAMMRE